MIKVGIVLMLLLTGCDREITYDKGFYYKVSHITIPNTFLVNESVDNAKFVTITSFKADSASLMHFIYLNALKAIDLKTAYKLDLVLNI